MTADRLGLPRCGVHSPRRRPSCVVTGLVLLASIALASAARAWDATTPPHFFPSPFDSESFAGVAFQPNGGIIVAGTHRQPDVGVERWACKVVVARLVRGTGAVDWRTETPDCGDNETYPFDPGRSPGKEIVRVDASGDVFIARFRAAGSLIEVVKLDGDSGSELWRTVAARPGERNATTHAMTLDASGDVIVAGGDGTNDRVPTDLFVAKLSGATGAELWRRELRGPASQEDDARNRVDAVAVDGEGHVIVHGVLYDLDEEDTPLPIPLLLSLDGADGHERWRADGIAREADVAYDSTDDGVIVAAAAEVAKVRSGDGTFVWRTRVGTGAFPSFRARVASVAVRGDQIAVAADASESGGFVVWIRALDGESGALRWQHAIDTPDGSDPFRLIDRASGVALDDAGNVVVAATIVDQGVVLRPLVAAFDATSGAELWRRTYPGTSNAHGGGAFDLRVAHGKAAVVGGIGKPGVFSDAFVALLDVATGAEEWIDDESARLPGDTRGVWLDEIALDAAIDPRGDVVAVGQTWAGVESVDFTVRKVDGASGRIAWRVEEPRAPFEAPRRLFDFAIPWRVLIGQDGDPVVLADTLPAELVKLDGTDGSEVWSSPAWPFEIGGDPSTTTLALDRAGDVFVGGDDIRSLGGRLDAGMVVGKISGASGTRLWDAFFSSSRMKALEVAPSGDVIALGQQPFELGRKPALVKYDGATGAERWRHVVATAFLPNLLTLDAKGNALVAARREIGNDFSAGIVVKVDGASGAKLWQSAVFPVATTALVVDQRGDVFATANNSEFVAEDQPLRYSPAAVKLDATTGATLWQRSLADLGNNVEVTAAVLDGDGNLVVSAREVPGRTWLAGLASSDGTLRWTIALGDADTTFDVRALLLRQPGEIVVAGASAAPGEGTGFAVVEIDVPSIVGPSPGGRSCVVRVGRAGGLRGTALVDRCTSLDRKLATRR